MTERNEFDDLARRKLEEREFPFREADWREAQRLIQAQRRPVAAWRTWLLVGTGLVLLGTTAWWMDRSTSHGAMPGTMTDQQLSDATDRTTGPVGDVQGGTPIERGPKVTTGSVQDLAGQDLREGPSVAETSKAALVIDRTALPANRSSKAGPTTVGTAGNALSATTTPEHEHATNGWSIPVVASPVEETHLNGTDETARAEQPAADRTDIGNDATEGSRVEPASSTAPATAGTIATDGRTAAASAEQAPEADPALNAQESLADPESTGIPPATTTALHDPVTSPPQDTAATTALPPPVAPLITAASPWEIGILFGGLRSASTYTGGGSAEWNSGVKGGWAPSLGAEMMHMGRNFGIGGGVHYTTYEEELDVEERYLTNTVVQDSNYFVQVDTTFMYVIGNVQINGQDWYVTGSLDTTINVLVLGTNTFTSSRKLNERLHVVNRLSYVEIPLLMDAHLTQGPWLLGLRGGPTIGVLSGREGTVPNEAFDGFTPYTDRAFRSPVAGFTMRAYIRYRSMDGWAVGLEPTYRSQFGNAFGDGNIVRRNSGIGAMLSLSYRLR